MIINRLKLHNFGVYAFDNTFVFNNDKPVVLIGGMNGRGKTTFLEAILLALYGKNSFAFQESKHSSYGGYLKAHTNESDKTYKSFVELEFSVNEDNHENIYVVNRSWDANGKHIKDKVSVWKNGSEDIFLTQNWTMFVESILPSALANFYFFDGEKIAELAEGETSLQMKNSIKALLGINIIDLLDNDLTRIIKKLDNETQEEYDGVNVEELCHIRDEKESALKEIDEEISELQKQLSIVIKKIDNKTEEFNAKGGGIASQSHELYSERISLNTRLNQIQESFLEIAAGELPLVMVSDLLNSIYDKSSEEKEQKSMKIAVSKIDELFELYSRENDLKNSDAYKFIEFMKNKASGTEKINVFNLSENAYAQNTLLLNGQLDNVLNTYISNRETEKRILERINEIDNYLSVDIDEKAIQRIYKRICELQTKRTELEVQIENKKKQRVTINGEFLAASNVFNKCVEKMIATMERKDDIERIHNYAMLAQSVANKFKVELQKAKITELADTMTNCYKKILGKKNLIERIEMNSDTLDYHYLDIEGNEVMKSSLSAGEKQLMVIAMLWALAECSNKLLPVIIDTPLARLDSLHRKALIERYFPYASSQTIILSTDSEIDESYYKIIKPFVSNEFTLVYNEKEKRSYIKEGYFEEVTE